MIENKNLKITTKSIERKGNERNPITIKKHESLGPFVRISEKPDLQYVYISAFFKINTLKKSIIVPHETAITDNTAHIIISQYNNPITSESDKYYLWEIVLKCEQLEDNKEIIQPFKDIKELEVTVIFNIGINNPKIGEPKRGTKVIPPVGG